MPSPKHERDRRHDAKRRHEKPWRNLYKTSRWQRLREAQLSAHPLCQRCLEATPRRITPATVVHHVEKHEGDPVKFWQGPFRSVCSSCHNAIEQGIEARGFETGADATGRPIDPNHPWNRCDG